jgi:uncharacterized protein (TIGR02453 family)
MQHSLDFLKQLQSNNTREWFEKHRPEFEVSKKEIQDLSAVLIQEIGKFDAGVLKLTSKDCIFRINRDVRFSKNKAPYKNNIGAAFTDGGKKSPKAGYYIQIQSGASFIAAGVWMPEAPVLQAIRQEIYFNHINLRGIIGKGNLQSMFNTMGDHQLKTAPKGYDKDHPAIDLLRYKSFVLSRSLSDKEVLSKDFALNAASIFKEMSPFIEFLNSAISLSEN